MIQFRKIEGARDRNRHTAEPITSARWAVLLEGVEVGEVESRTFFGPTGAERQVWTIVGAADLFPTRKAAGARLEVLARLEAGDPIVVHALPADPFEGI